MTINVTQDHIEAGFPDNCHNCPVALALNRATGHKWTVEREYAGLMNSKTGTLMYPEVRVIFPLSVREFTRNFDQGNPVSPFSFEIDWEPD